MSKSCIFEFTSLSASARTTFKGLLIASTSLALVLGNLVFGDLPPRTAIDDYVEAEDPITSHEIVSKYSIEGMTLLVVKLTSQNWLSENEVNQTKWEHWLNVYIPDNPIADVGLLYIGGGNKNSQPPTTIEGRTAQLALATRMVVADLGQVPNQPLIFHGDGQERYEDDLIAYAWIQYLETKDPEWLPRNAMVKAATTAMDAVSDVVATETDGELTLPKFVVTGGSKRGWTAWLTAAMDSSVIAVAPIVIDVLNTQESMTHHFANYGFWAPAIGNYVDHGLMYLHGNPDLAKLYELVDPYYYRHRIKMPKYVINASGDEFFLPDSSQFYWDDLVGPKYLRYVPNAGHSLSGSDAIESLAAFSVATATGSEIPDLGWEYTEDGSIRVETTAKPTVVRLWHAHNPNARDFRVVTLGPVYQSKLINPDEDGAYTVTPPAVESGWLAWYLEFEFDIGAATPLKLSVPIQVLPETQPFSDKDPTLPTYVTVKCQLGSTSFEAVQASIQGAFKDLQASESLRFEQESGWLYVNWQHEDNWSPAIGALQPTLEEAQCASPAIQLESGETITKPPLTASTKAD